MGKRIIGTIILLAMAPIGCIGWYFIHGEADPETLLEQSDLTDSSVSYSWTGRFSLGNYDVHARFSGTGEAILQVGDEEPSGGNEMSGNRHKFDSARA